MKRFLTLLFLLAAHQIAVAQETGFSSVEPLSSNARLLYGNGLAVRLQEHGYFEAFLQIADANHKLQLRSLSYTGEGRNKRRTPRVQVTLSDFGGKKPHGVIYPKSPKEAQNWAEAYDKKYAVVGDDHIYLKAVPGTLNFNVAEFTVKAGEFYRFILENPDIIMHNFILTKPGKANAVGELSDALAATPDGLKKHYIPESDLVLFATEQVPPGETLEKKFKAPSQPGAYPFICSFPGHWQIMRGTMTVK